MSLVEQKAEDFIKDHHLVFYKKIPVWNVKTLPQTFRKCHNTRQGVWAKLCILSGSLTMEYLNDHKEVIKQCDYSVVNQPNFIQPRQYHRIAACSQDMTCQLSFYSEE